MGSSTISCSNFNPKSIQRNHNSALERRPRLLKDFLYDDNSNSCSSNGFKSFPRKSSQNSSIFRENPNHGPKLQRSRSKAASTTISAFQAMINAVKSIHFVSSVKLSRKISKRNSQSSHYNVENKVTVTVKDIIRWKSFRDLVEEKSQPSDFASSSSPPHHCTTTTTTGSNTPCSSNGSSWCDSDFTSSEYSPPDEFGGNEVDRKKLLPCGVGNSKVTIETTTKTTANTYVGPKHASEDKEQHSPLSVLDFGHEEELECEMVKLVKAWIDEEHNEMTKWRLADKTEACVRDMENEGKWKNFKFDEEQEAVALGVERWVLNILVDELLFDLL